MCQVVIINQSLSHACRFAYHSKAHRYIISLRCMQFTHSSTYPQHLRCIESFLLREFQINDLFTQTMAKSERLQMKRIAEKEGFSIDKYHTSNLQLIKSYFSARVSNMTLMSCLIKRYSLFDFKRIQYSNCFTTL